MFWNENLNPITMQKRETIVHLEVIKKQKRIDNDLGDLSKNKKYISLISLRNQGFRYSELNKIKKIKKYRYHEMSYVLVADLEDIEQCKGSNIIPDSDYIRSTDLAEYLNRSLQEISRLSRKNKWTKKIFQGNAIWYLKSEVLK